MQDWRRRLITLTDGWLDQVNQNRSFGWVVGLSFFILGLVPRFFYSLPGDSLIYAYLAGRLLDGEKYFTGFFEFNTPYAIGAYVPSLWLARAIGIPDATGALLFGTLLALFSFLLVRGILLRSYEWDTPLRHNALLIALAFSLNFCFIEPATRTIIFACLVLPYLFFAQLRLEKQTLPVGLQMLIGAMLGYALLLKPNYLLFPAVIELFVLYRRRRIKQLFVPANIAAGLVCVCGYAALPVFFPGYIKSVEYFLLFYSGDMRGIHNVIDNLLTAFLYLLPLLLWVWALNRQLISLPLLWAAIAAECAVLESEMLLSGDQKSLLAFFVGVAFITSLILFLRAPLQVRRSVGTLRKLVAVFAVLLAAISIFRVSENIYAFVPHEVGRDTVKREMLSYIARYAPGGSFYAISETPEHFLPALMATPRHPYPMLHSLRLLTDHADRREDFIRAGKEEQWKKAEDYIYASVLSYFREQKPTLVFASRLHGYKEIHPRCLPVPLDMMLARSPEFAREWRHYHKIGSIITEKDRQWLETRGQSHPVGSWLDVYMRDK